MARPEIQSQIDLLEAAESLQELEAAMRPASQTLEHVELEPAEREALAEAWWRAWDRWLPLGVDQPRERWPFRLGQTLRSLLPKRLL